MEGERMKETYVPNILKYNDYEIEPVPENERHNLMDLSFVYIGFATSMAAFMIGLSLGLNFMMRDVVLVIFLGTIFLTMVDCISSVLAYRTGLTWALAARRIYGKKGALLPVLLTGIIYSGWQGFNLTWAPDFAAASWGWPFAPIVVVCGIVYASSAYIGFSGLKWISKILMPIFAVTFIGLIVLSIKKIGWNSLNTYIPEISATKSALASAFIGQWLLASITGSFDINRFAKNIKSAVFASVSGHIFRAMVVFSGYCCAVAFKTTAVSGIIEGYGIFWQVIAFVIIFLVMWTTADNSAYSAALSFSGTIRFLSKKSWVLIIMGFGTFMTIVGAIKYFVVWLNIIASVMPSLPGILAAETLIGPMMGLKNPLHEPERKVRYSPVLTWIVCAGIGYYLYAVAKVPFYPVWVFGISIIIDILFRLVLDKNKKTNDKK
ncbi:MAG TPA: hypothetical protein DHU59_03885 [Clostridiales bacterium]|nr:hypothetical protein [Clostridiales bacterium]